MSSDTHAIVFSTVSRLAGNFASVKTRPHALSREKNRDKEISRSVGIFWWDVRLVISYSIIQCWGVIMNNLEANKSVINTALAARPPARIYAITRYIVALIKHIYTESFLYRCWKMLQKDILAWYDRHDGNLRPAKCLPSLPYVIIKLPTFWPVHFQESRLSQEESKSINLSRPLATCQQPFSKREQGAVIEPVMFEKWDVKGERWEKLQCIGQM